MITFKFDPNQSFQLQAIRSVTDLFKQQVFQPPAVLMSGGAAVIPNSLELENSIILKNLQAVQKINGLEISSELKGLDFSIEMETGTGKTYVYLRTVLELNRKFGFRKFIIIVPSIAIREGVLKTLQITREHFTEIYDGQPYRYVIYQSRALSQLRQFALSDSVEILIMTIDSFNKDSNVIRNYTDRLAGARPIDLIRGTHPILILDEPQNMESEKARQAIKTLNSLFTLRYSATHRHYYNLVYRLTPFDAYRMGLVKQIEVYSITEMNKQDQAYIAVQNIFRKNGKLLTRLQLDARDRNGGIKRKVLQFKSGDSIYSKTKLSAYKNFILSEINLKEKKIAFSNGQTFQLGQISGSDRKMIMKQQIQTAIREHLQKRSILRQQGIKNLSLFFIDQVNNYLDKDGWIRTFFEQQFERINRELKLFRTNEATEVHNGYFSKKKTDRAIEQDRRAFDLIMRDKERLLSLDEPVEFIFSHSALREGWDNPNVFNICTLNYSHSQIKKRQEIGRGIRLCVNQNGERIFDADVNRLTVIANENYADYVARLQTEYDEEYGGKVPKPEVHNALLRRTIKPKSGFEQNPYFKKIWETISRKTVFDIYFNNQAFQRECTRELNQIKIEPASMLLTRAKADLQSGKFRAKAVSQNRLDSKRKQAIKIPSVIDEIQTATGLTRNTIVELLAANKSLDQMLNNPEQYISDVIQIIIEILPKYIKDGIRYRSAGSTFDLRKFKPYEDYENQLLEVKKTIYPHLPFSTAEERDFIAQLESQTNVLFYLKIPTWFSINTPFGKHKPNWVVLLKRGRTKLLAAIDFLNEASNDSTTAAKQHSVKQHLNVLGVDYYQLILPENFDTFVHDRTLHLSS